MNCRTEQIIVGAGNDYLLMLLSVILGRGHKVAMENPTYISAYRCFAKLGYAMCTISMDEAGMRPAELEKSGADLAYIMPSHQFPMGMVMPMKRRMQLLAWASRENGRYLIEDDYDSEFRYKGRPIPALQGNDTEGKVIYLGTFSRAIAPSIRISYMVLPETLLPAYEENGRCFSATVSKTDQKILEEFMRSGAFERHLNRMRAQYKGKHDLLIRLLKEFGREYTVSGENAASMCWSTCREDSPKRRRCSGQKRMVCACTGWNGTASALPQIPHRAAQCCLGTPGFLRRRLQRQLRF